MDINEAWETFQQSRSIRKTSIAEKLDTIAAQLNEIQTDSKRTAELVPKILGDDAAIEASNAQMPGMDPSMMGMGGAPPMGDTMGGPMGGPEGDPTGGLIGGPEGGAVPGAEDMSPGGMDLNGPGDSMTDDTEMPMGDEEYPEDESAPMGTDDLGAVGTDEAIPGPMDEGVPGGDLGGGAPMDEDYEDYEGGLGTDLGEDLGGASSGNGTVDALVNMLHEKVDEGNMDDVRALADAIEQLQGGLTPDYGGGSDINGGTFGQEFAFAESATGLDAPAVADIQPVQQSADDTNESPEEKVQDIIEQAVAEVLEAMGGDVLSAPAPEGEVSIEVEAEPEEAAEESSEEAPEAPDEGEEDDDEEKSTEEDLSSDGEAPFKECDDNAPEGPTVKSAMDLSFRDMLAAKMEGRDLLDGYIAKNDDTQGFPELDPWGRARRDNMFKKTEDLMDSPTSDAVEPTEPTVKSDTAADDVKDPKSIMSGKRNGTDSTTVADDISDADELIKGNAPKGGDMLDDVNEEKGSSDHSVQGGEPLDDVDEKKGKSDHSVKGGDLLDDVDEKKGKSDHEAKGGDMLDDVDEMKKSDNIGKEIPTLREMMAMRKSGARPDTVSSVNGDLERPQLGKIQKSAAPEPVRMGRGVDPHKVTAADWEEYNLYMAQKGL